MAEQISIRPLLETLAEQLGVHPDVLPSADAPVAPGVVLGDIALVVPHPPFPVDACSSRSQHGYTRDLCFDVIGRLCDRKADNVLRNGYARPDGWYSEACMPDAPQLSCLYENPAVELVTSVAFEQLHAAIGDGAMLHLLGACSLLARLEGLCYLQLSGLPVTALPLAQLHTFSIPSLADKRANGPQLAKPAEPVGAAARAGPTESAANDGASAQPAGAPPSAPRVDTRPPAPAPPPAQRAASAGRLAPEESSSLDWVVPRWTLLYATRPARGLVRLSRAHPLEQLKDSAARARTRGRRLAAHVLGLADGGGLGRPYRGRAFGPPGAAPPLAPLAGGVGKARRRVARLPPRAERLAAVLACLTKRHARCRYAELLEAACRVRADGTPPLAAPAARPPRVCELRLWLRRHFADASDADGGGGYVSQEDERGERGPMAVRPEPPLLVAAHPPPPLPLQPPPPRPSAASREAGAAAPAAPRAPTSEAARSRSRAALSALLDAETPRAHAAQFACSIIQKVVPRALVGSAHNWRLLLRAARRLALAPRSSLPSGRVLIFKMRQRDVPWLVGAHGRLEASALRPASQALARVLLWLTSRLLLPLLRVAFCATEGTGAPGGSQRLHFFRHAAWSKLCAHAIRSSAHGLRLRALGGPDAELAEPSLGVSALRFQPKFPHGVRPICRLSAPALPAPPYTLLAAADGGAPRSTFATAAAGGGGGGLRGGGGLGGGAVARSVNQQLASVFSVLRSEVQAQPALLGNSVLGLSGIQERLVQLAAAARARAPMASDARAGGDARADGAADARADGAAELHFVSTDARACFDTIEHPTLLATLDATVQAPSYVTRTYAVLKPTHRPALDGGGGGGGGSASGARARPSWWLQPPRRSFSRVACEIGSYELLPNAQQLRALVGSAPAGDGARAAGGRVASPSVVIDLSRQQLLSRGQCLQTLHSHIRANLLTAQPPSRRPVAGRAAAAPLARGVQVQTVGIAQGSCVATLLCSLHYAALDQAHLARFGEGAPRAAGGGAAEGGEAPAVRGLVRLIDDFLFGSSAPAECVEFLAAMHGGYAEYGCEANVDKSRAAPTDALGAALRGAAVRTSGLRERATGQSFFAWCGLLIGSRGPTVQKDFQALAGRGVTADLRFNCGRASGAQLAAKLRQTIVVRCHPIFADPRLCDERTALLNLYQASGFAALRLVALARRLPHTNERFIVRLIEAAVELAARLVARTRACGASDAADAPQRELVFARAQAQAHWLGLTAFVRVLRRRQPSMRAAIAELEARLRAPQLALVLHAHRELLRAASDDSLQSARPLRTALAR